MNETAKRIAEALEKVEQTHRRHGRAVAELHRALAQAVAEHGAEVGLDDGLIATAAAPKVPPTNGTDD